MHEGFASLALRQLHSLMVNTSFGQGTHCSPAAVDEFVDVVVRGRGSHPLEQAWLGDEYDEVVAPGLEQHFCQVIVVTLLRLAVGL